MSALCQVQAAKGRHAVRLQTQAAASVAEAPTMQPATSQQHPGQSTGFYTGTDGYLYCDDLRVDDIRQQVPPENRPFYL